MKTMVQTPYQMLAEVSRTVRQPLVLKHGETLNATVLTPTVVILRLTVIKTVERSVGFKVVASGNRLVCWRRDPVTLVWTQDEPMTVWDTDFVPYEVGTRFRTTAESAERKEWEEMCHRWGNGSRFGQRDNYDRQIQDMPNPPTFSSSESEDY